MREQAQLRGSVTYNEATAAIVSVELANIASAVQMGLMPDLEDFWMSQSLEELAESQGVSAIDRIEVLQDDTISEKEAADFLAALEL